MLKYPALKDLIYRNNKVYHFKIQIPYNLVKTHKKQW